MGAADYATLQCTKQAAEEGASAGYQLAVQGVKRNRSLMRVIRTTR
jgi:hypothetical protein